MNALQGQYDKLSDLKDCIVSAAILKKWLRSLSPLLIPSSLYDKVLEAGESKNVEKCLAVVRQLSREARDTLVYIFEFLNEMLAYKDKTKMGAVNFSVVITPNIVRGNNLNPVTMMVNNKSENGFVETLIENIRLLEKPE